MTCDLWHVTCDQSRHSFPIGKPEPRYYLSTLFSQLFCENIFPIICFFFQFLHCTEVWPLWKCARNVSFFYSAARFKRAIYCCAKLSGRLPSLCNFLGPTIRQETNDFFSRWMGGGIGLYISHLFPILATFPVAASGWSNLAKKWRLAIFSLFRGIPPLNPLSGFAQDQETEINPLRWTKVLICKK